MNQQEKLYMNDKEASLRYGYSRQWFQRQRWIGGGPSFIKVNGGRVLYKIKEIDGWFDNFSSAKKIIKKTDIEKDISLMLKKLNQIDADIEKRLLLKAFSLLIDEKDAIKNT